MAKALKPLTEAEARDVLRILRRVPYNETKKEKPMAKVKKQASMEEREAAVIENMSAARVIADNVFGPEANPMAVEEICNWIEAAGDEEKFIADLEGVMESARAVYPDRAITPEHIFGGPSTRGLFDRIHGEE